MDLNFETKLEFGDFESSVDFEPADGCVELPSSWLVEDANDCELSFSVPSQCNGIAIASENEQLLKKIEFLGFEQEILEMPPVKQSNPVKAVKNIVGDGLCNKSNNAKQQSKETVTAKKFTENGNSELKPDGILSEPVFAKNAQKVVAVSDEPKSDAKEQASDVSEAVEESAEKEIVEIPEPISKNSMPKVKSQPIAKPGSSWAGLFKGKDHPSTTKMVVLTSNHSEKKVLQDSNAASVLQSKQTDNSVPNGLPESVKHEDKISSNNSYADKLKTDKHAELLAKLLSKLDLKFKPQAFIPRGLINSSNWCYINATLQALLMCPPFYQLLKSLPANDKINNYSETVTPTIDCFVKLASEFHPLSTKKGYQTGKEMRQGHAFAPECVYDMLSATKSSLSDSGKQEDAEEFLSSALNGLHEEMVKLFQLSNDEGSEIARDIENSINENYSPPEKTTHDSDGEEWEEVITTKRNRSAVTRRADTSKTPISKIFRGELCTSVFRPGQKLSISHEPFYCLPLAVPTENEGYWSVEDAMYALANKESFIGNDQDQTASRQQALETLPPILILHLKRFVYDKNGGSKKLDRKMDFKSDLVIPKDIMSKTSKKYSHLQRTYKLFAVVCHHGERATGGHYSADVFHIGMSSWLRIDDQNIKTVSHSDVTRYNATRTPYLLFYRRTDLG